LVIETEKAGWKARTETGSSAPVFEQVQLSLCLYCLKKRGYTEKVSAIKRVS
jgi:sulfur relay (sulfurtransferase) complex TusBCD TusD component (DsrE family)